MPENKTNHGDKSLLKSFKMLEKKLKTSDDGKTFYAPGLIDYVKMAVPVKAIYRSNTTSTKIPVEKTPRLCMNTLKITDS